MGISTDTPRASPHTRYTSGVRVNLVLASALLFITVACGDDGPAVPFGLDTPHPETTGAPPTSVAASPGATEWPEGADVRVDDSVIAIEGAQVRATLATDVDGDGDRDVVFAAGTADGSVSLGIATRTPQGLTFAPPMSIASVCAPPAIGSMRLVSLSADLVAARVERTCSGAIEQRVALVRTSRGARVLQTIVLSPQDGETLTVRGEDRDDDGNEDVVVHVSLHDASGESADIDLAWLDRAAGLSRDTAEPEATVAARANEARTALRRHPDRALAATRTALLVHDALCGASARLAIDDDLGIVCPASVGLGRALTIAAAAEARQGHVQEALAAVVALSRTDATIRDADRAVAREALAAMTGVLHPVTVDSIEARPASSADTPRLSTLAFLSEDRLLVRSGNARVVTLSTGTSEPSTDSDTTLADPSRAHYVADVERGCGGTQLEIRRIFGPLDSPSDEHTLALVAARPPPAGAVCNDLVPNDAGLSLMQRRDGDGWRVLGWAPQGALVARGATLVLVPLDLAGAPVGGPTTLADGEPAPAPIAPGHATADASVWAFVNEVGLVLYRRGSAPQLVMPTPFTRAEGTTVDVAVSPSATRLAWIEGGHVRWVDLAAPIPPPPPTSAAVVP